MIVNPVVYGGGGKEPVVENLSASQVSITEDSITLTASQNIAQLTGAIILSLAGQELGHYDTLCRSGEKILDRNHGTEEQRTVWGALMSTSGDWATELREKIDRVRHTN